MNLKQILKYAVIGIVCVFALIGLFLTAGYFAVKLGLTNEKGIVDSQRDAFLGGKEESSFPDDSTTVTDWKTSQEWAVMEAAIRKDPDAINRAANDADVPARLIVANLVAEQLRLFFTEREFYKQFFYPLKILGSQTQFSWGVMGMKEATAVEVEQHLKDPSSPYYPGEKYEHLLDFQTTDIEKERFSRMTDQHNHYWSYLYAGLYLKEIEAQWKDAGFPITDRPDILSTLFNIGFTHSNPNANPQAGGAAITVGQKTYSFGGLAADFYSSGILTDLFPQ